MKKKTSYFPNEGGKFKMERSKGKLWKQSDAEAQRERDIYHYGHASSLDSEPGCDPAEENNNKS